eukprot:4552309-Heterocapsa_arctica.AAC.1
MASKRSGHSARVAHKTVAELLGTTRKGDRPTCLTTRMVRVVAHKKLVKENRKRHNRRVSAKLRVTDPAAEHKYNIARALVSIADK